MITTLEDANGLADGYEDADAQLVELAGGYEEPKGSKSGVAVVVAVTVIGLWIYFGKGGER